MDSLKIGNIEIKRCPCAKSRYDVFETRSGEELKKEYTKDVAYGVSLDRAVALVVEITSFDESKDLVEFIDKYRELKEDLVTKIRELSKKVK